MIHSGKQAIRSTSVVRIKEEPDSNEADKQNTSPDSQQSFTRTDTLQLVYPMSCSSQRICLFEWIDLCRYTSSVEDEEQERSNRNSRGSSVRSSDYEEQGTTAPHT